MPKHFDHSAETTSKETTSVHEKGTTFLNNSKRSDHTNELRFKDEMSQSTFARDLGFAATPSSGRRFALPAENQFTSNQLEGKTKNDQLSMVAHSFPVVSNVYFFGEL